MTQSTRTLGDGSLIELLDRLVETGVAATGDLLLGLADVDLIRVNLQLVLGAVDTLADNDGPAPPVRSGAPHPAAPDTGNTDSPAERYPATPAGPPEPVPYTPRATAVPAPPAALQLDRPDRADLGVGALLIAVIEIVHRLLERQAIHRMEHGSLTGDQVERLGQALMLLDQRINQLIEIFGVRSTPALPATVAGTAH
ncbi:gas vesicle protein GvpJ [Jatrophihabitans sp.]|uniref:gas vesicle protein GvpJ n=1 Tax=Jatrophihabitans sp. TaxID=1932789 RepID=UPI002B6FFFCF|nr:gas vesicle protein GvpJ [Jatrophihabitans sp.]